MASQTILEKKKAKYCFSHAFSFIQVCQELMLSGKICNMVLEKVAMIDLGQKSWHKTEALLIKAYAKNSI